MEFLTPAIEELIKQGGGYLLAFFLGVWVYLQDRRLREQQAVMDKMTKEANEEVQEQFEKRLAEFRELLDAMTNSTSSVNALKGSLAPVTEAINQMVVGLAKLLQEFQSQQVRWDESRQNMFRQLEDLRLRLEAIQREARVA